MPDRSAGTLALNTESEDAHDLMLKDALAAMIVSFSVSNRATPGRQNRLKMRFRRFS